MASLDYRPEIDGLRAVAILTVLLFHLDVPLFGGGFVGVDVFFVISGYLITRILRRDLDGDRFSLFRFYGRRLRRLFPALVVTLALTLVAGLWLLTPTALVSLALDSLYATLSFANVRFAAESGYFADASGVSALLHTWSLSVEEQFYLFWPALLWLVGRRGRWTMPVTLLALSVASLVTCELALVHDPVTAFFWMPYRIWELGLGALLTWVPRSDGMSRSVREIALGAGLVAIFAASITYDEQTVFPGTSAALPCLGSALCIWAGNTPGMGAILRNRVAVGIGKLSYAVYLAHWPLVVFTKQALPRPLAPLDQLALTAASFVLAIVLHTQVERRFRYARGGVSGRAFAIGAASFTLVASGLAHHIRVEGGLPDRYPETFRAFVAGGSRVTAAEAEGWREGTCFLNSTKGHGFDDFDRARCLALDPRRRNVLLFGDSAAAHLYHGLDAVHGERIHVLQATAASCRGAQVARDPTCTDLYRHVLDTWLPDHGADLDAIVFAARWDRASLLPWIEQQVTRMRVHDTPIVLVGPPVDHDTPIVNFVASRHGPWTADLDEAGWERLRVPAGNLRVHLPRMDHEVASLAKKLGLYYVSLLAPQCDGVGCLAAVRDGERWVPMQRDRIHFTLAGSRWIAAQLPVDRLTGGGS